MDILSKSKRILYLDGIKGVASLFIFFHHFMILFFPASYHGDEKPSLLNGFDTLLSSSPLGIIVNGNFFMHLFVFISGYVITSHVINMKMEKFGFFHLKRYLKLFFALAVYTLIFFIFNLANNIYGNDFKQILKSVYNLFCSLFIGILFRGETYSGTNLWMLNYIFVGGIFVSIVAALCWIFDGRKVFFIPLVIGFILFLQPSFENINWATVFWGCALCLYNKYYHVNFNKFCLILLIVSLLLGAFPSGVIPKNFYRYMLLPYKESYSCFYWHSVASVLFILSVTNSNFLQNLFSKKIFLKLAKISLWIYLLQIFSLILAEYIYNSINCESHTTKALCAFVVSFVELIGTSVIFEVFVSNLGTKFINLIVCFLEKK